MPPRARAICLLTLAVALGTGTSAHAARGMEMAVQDDAVLMGFYGNGPKVLKLMSQLRATRIRGIRPGLALAGFASDERAERAFCNQLDARRQSDPERSEPDSPSVDPKEGLGNRNPSPRRAHTYIASRHQPAVAPTGPGTLNRHDSIHASGRAIGA